MCGCENHWNRSAVCTCNCPSHAGRRHQPAPRHRNGRHQDACSLVCEAGHEGGGNCTTYVGQHQAEATS